MIGKWQRERAQQDDLKFCQIATLLGLDQAGNMAGVHGWNNSGGSMGTGSGMCLDYTSRVHL